MQFIPEQVPVAVLLSLGNLSIAIKTAARAKAFA